MMTVPIRDDLIVGAHKIGLALGLPRKAVYRLAEHGLPVFKLTDATSSPLCAKRTSLALWLAKREADASGISTALRNG